MSKRLGGIIGYKYQTHSAYWLIMIMVVMIIERHRAVLVEGDVDES